MESPCRPHDRQNVIAAQHRCSRERAVRRDCDRSYAGRKIPVSNSGGGFENADGFSRMVLGAGWRGGSARRLGSAVGSAPIEHGGGAAPTVCIMPPYSRTNAHGTHRDGRSVCNPPAIRWRFEQRPQIARPLFNRRRRFRVGPEKQCKTAVRALPPGRPRREDDSRRRRECVTLSDREHDRNLHPHGYSLALVFRRGKAQHLGDLQRCLIECIVTAACSDLGLPVRAVRVDEEPDN